MTSSSEPVPGDRLRAAALAGLGTLFSPYFFESYYVPLILKAADPKLFPGDLFVGSAGVYKSFFFSLLGAAAKYADLGLLMPVLYALIVCASAVLVFELAMALLGDRKAAFLAVFLLLLPKSAVSVAFAGIDRGAVEPSTFAGVFLLLAVLLFIKGRRTAACLLASSMVYVQGMEAAITAGMFFWSIAAGSRTRPLRETSAAVAALALPALPMIVSAARSGFFGSAPSPEENSLWLGILHARSWYHLFPFSWGVSDWFNYSGWFIWALLVAVHGRPIPRVVRQFVYAVAAMCAFSTLFSEVFPVPFVIKLVLWRSTIYFLMFLLIYSADYLAKKAEEGAPERYLAAAAAAAIFLGQYKLVVCAGLLWLGLESREKRWPRRLLVLAGAAGGLAFCAGPLLRYALPSGRLASFLDIGGISAGLFLAVAAALAAWFSGGRLRRAAAVLMAGAGTAAFLLGWTPSGVRPSRGDGRAWRLVQDWARENTAPGDIFITPPYLEGFRVHSRRGTVLELKDGAAAVYDARFGLAWWRRLNDFGYTNLAVDPEMGRKVRALYEGMDGGALAGLARKYGASYVIREEGCPSGMRAVYTNERFALCSFGAGGRGPGADLGNERR